MRSCLVLLALYGLTMPILKVQAQSSTEPMLESKSVIQPDTHIVPSLQVSERYDSNVFFVPGTNLDDYVTTVSPQFTLTHKNQWLEGTVGGGVTAEAYVKNPGLNYAAGNGTIDLNLDSAMNRLVQGLGLRMADTFLYTPQPPAFAAPTSGSRISEVFVQGIQARRANSFTNAAKVEASYFFSPFMGVLSTYTDRRIRFGAPITSPTGIEQGRFLNTTFQTLTSGLVRKLSPVDTISLAYQYQTGTFSVPDGSESRFSTHGAMVKWSRSITQTLELTGEGGFAVISPSGSVQSQGTGALEWKGQYTTAMVSYSRTIAPSFLVVSTPLLSQVVTAAVTRRIADPLSLSLTGSYAVNESVPDSSLLRFHSYSIIPSINYVISKSFTATLSYTHNQFNRTFGSQSLPFDRDLVQFSLVAQWK